MSRKKSLKRVLLASDSFSGITTTFIRNDIDYLISRNKIVSYLVNSEASQKGYKNLKIYNNYFKHSYLKNKIFNFLYYKLKLYCSFKNSKYSQKLNEIVNITKPDIIHCHFGFESLKIIQNIKTEIPIIVQFHGYDASQELLNKSYVRRLRKICIHKNIYCFGVSNYIQKSLNDNKIYFQKYFTLRCGVDTDFFTPQKKIHNSYKTFLQVSSFNEKKGHFFTLKSIFIFFKNYPKMRESVKFIFTGDGDKINQFQNFCTKNNIDKNVCFYGNASKDDVKKLLNRADYFLHPSVTSSKGDKEGIPTSIMEAMSMELPIISTFHAGIPELVENGVNGLLSQERDVNKLSENIYKILTWGRLALNRNKILCEYSSKIHNSTLEKYYETILNSNFD